jgi:hypothetical protein
MSLHEVQEEECHLQNWHQQLHYQPHRLRQWMSNLNFIHCVDFEWRMEQNIFSDGKWTGIDTRNMSMQISVPQLHQDYGMILNKHRTTMLRGGWHCKLAYK